MIDHELFEIDPHGLPAKDRMRLIVLDYYRQLKSMERAIQHGDDIMGKLEFLADTPAAKAWVKDLAKAWDRDRKLFPVVEQVSAAVEAEMGKGEFRRAADLAVEDFVRAKKITLKKLPKK